MGNISRTPSLLFDTNITLEDGLGRVMSLPYEHFSEYSMILARLRVAFEGCPGELKVAREQFSLHHIGSMACWGDFNWKTGLYPGAKIRMSFLILGVKASTGHCPRCGSVRKENGHATSDWATW